MDRRALFLADRHGPVTAVAAWRATAEEREQALSPHENYFLVRGLEREAATATLVALFNLACGMDAFRTAPWSRQEMVARIRSALERGLLLIVPGWAFVDSGAGRPSAIDRDRAPDDHLAESLMGDRRDLVIEKHRYRVISVRRWRDRQQRALSSSDFRPLPKREARAVIGRLSESSQTPAASRPLWKQALERLYDSAANRVGAEGVMLLRYTPPAGSFAEDTVAPAPPPSRARSKVAPTDWIEIEIVYEDGAAFEEDLGLQLPDGLMTSGPADTTGRIRIDGIAPGSCLISVPSAQL